MESYTEIYSFRLNLRGNISTQYKISTWCTESHCVTSDNADGNCEFKSMHAILRDLILIVTLCFLLNIFACIL